jgi:hypothetical protein
MRRLMPVALLAWGLACACDPRGAVESVELERSEVVYATDDRLELYLAPTEALRRFGEESVVALVDDSALSDLPGGDPRALFASASLVERRGLCDTAPFAEQPAAVSCSGVLVGDDLVLTAGHCVRNLDCAALHLVFGYYYESAGQPSPIDVDDVYRCAGVPTFAVPSLLDRVDYGFIRLDRPVSSRQRPASLALEPVPVDPAAALHAFAFSGGIPLKLETSLPVLDPRAHALDYFVTALDAFEGGSGGPVIRDDGMVVGLLSGGNGDYQETSAGCLAVSVLPESAGGERVSYAFQAAAGNCRDAPSGADFCRPDSRSGPAAGCSLQHSSHANAPRWCWFTLLALLAGRVRRARREDRVVAVARLRAPAAVRLAVPRGRSRNTQASAHPWRVAVPGRDMDAPPGQASALGTCRVRTHH